MNKGPSWNACVSQLARKTFNPIRRTIETMDLDPNPDKEIIALSIGDPTTCGNLKPPKVVIEAVLHSLQSMRYNGYAPSNGFLEAREAVAMYCSVPNASIEAKNVILCSGCSHSLDMCISVLANPDQNILVPRPGFSLYKTLAEGAGIQCKSYNLLVFPGHTFYPIASLTTEVPVLSCGGLTKRFLIPGWRLGWIIIHDRHDILSQKVREGLQNLSQRIIGSNTLIQGALPDILSKTPQSFFDDTIAQVQANAEIVYSGIAAIPGIKPIIPQGAMYMMVKIETTKFPEITDDKDFIGKLFSQQSVMCLPGQCFDLPNYFRIVLTVTEVMIREACHRIAEFCSNYYQPHVRIRLNLIPSNPQVCSDRTNKHTELQVAMTDII